MKATAKLHGKYVKLAWFLDLCWHAEIAAAAAANLEIASKS